MKMVLEKQQKNKFNGTVNSDIKTSNKEFSGRVLSLEDIMKNRSNAYKFVL